MKLTPALPVFLLEILMASTTDGSVHFPWMAYILKRGKYGCSASIIKKSKILTVAQCVCHTDPRDLTVVTSTSKVNPSSGRRYSVSEIYMPAAFSRHSGCPIRYDAIAILKINPDISMRDTVEHSLVVDFGEIPQNGPVIKMGYGTDEKGKPGILRHIRSQGYPCDNFHGPMICSNTIDTTEREAGGPLLFCNPAAKPLCSIVGVNTGYAGHIVEFFLSANGNKAFIRKHL